MGKTCCITGHQKLPQEKLEKAKVQLRQEILSVIMDGYDHFISGFAQGVDLLCVQIVSELKQKSPVLLEAAIPYRNAIRHGNAELKRLFEQCDSFVIISQDYFPDCFLKRNMWMVDHSDMVIAVYDGRVQGGTAFTMKYAKTVGKEIHWIRV